MKEFKLKVVTPDRMFFEGDVTRVIVRTTQGDVGILAGHIDYISPLGIGELRIEKDGEENISAVAGGFIKVDKSEVIILASTCERADEIDLKRAEAKKQELETEIQNIKNEHEIDLVKIKLQKAINRINISHK